MKSFFLILIFFLCLIAACSQSYIVNMGQKTNYPEGRELFVSKCGGCHQLYNPNQFTPAVWDSMLYLMKKKAKISDEQKNEIYSWIIEIKDSTGNYSESGTNR
ncbi:MAG TPA: hypothetical protein VMT35_00850 [Ignavibacteriaceae bacterium]|nr:hypothetical protein [Ignavibacteriaceae bacterium]